MEQLVSFHGVRFCLTLPAPPEETEGPEDRASGHSCPSLGGGAFFTCHVEAAHLLEGSRWSVLLREQPDRKCVKPRLLPPSHPLQTAAVSAARQNGRAQRGGEMAAAGRVPSSANLSHNQEPSPHFAKPCSSSLCITSGMGDSGKQHYDVTNQFY